MTFEQIFQHCGLAGSYNLANLPSYAKALIEIERIESLRRNNAKANAVKIQPLGNHGLWLPKKLIIVTTNFNDSVVELNSPIALPEIDPLYDHVLFFNIGANSINLDHKSDNKERYLHSYLASDKKDKIIEAPLGVKMTFSTNEIEFVKRFIRENLAHTKQYHLVVNTPQINV